MTVTVGVLALQGGFQRHCDALTHLDHPSRRVSSRLVRTPEDLAGVDSLIIPGGESTTIGMLLERFGLMEPLRGRIRSGMPVMGTCAGTILLAQTIEGSEQPRIGTLPITVQRNAYGRQVASFEADLRLPEDELPFRAVFIRAPVITRVPSDVTVLATFEDNPVMIRRESILALTFHPELTGDQRIHRLFLAMS